MKRKHNDDSACATPLIELLQNVPEDARMTYEHHVTHHQMIPVGHLCHRSADRITELEEMNTAAEMLVRQTRKRITELEASTRKSIVTFNGYQEEMEALCTSYTARLKLAESYVPSFDWKMYQQAKAAIKGDCNE